MEALGYEVAFLDQNDPEAPFDSDAEVVCCGLSFYKAHIGDFPDLKFVQLLSIGYDGLSMEPLRARGAVLANAKGSNCGTLSEWILWKVLEGCKGRRVLEQRQRERRWERASDMIDLAGKEVCLIGFGDIGRETARRLKAFDARVTAVGRRHYESPWIDESALLGEREEILSRSDIVILAIQAVPETRHLLGKEEFAAMKDEAILVNAARGSLIDEEALTGELKKRRFRYAALDVFEEEPLPPESPLWGMENVSVTPHNAFETDRHTENAYRVIYENLKAFAEGRPVPTQIYYE